jgi:hypothetical protein
MEFFVILKMEEVFNLGENPFTFVIFRGSRQMTLRNDSSEHAVLVGTSNLLRHLENKRFKTFEQIDFYLHLGFYSTRHVDKRTIEKLISQSWRIGTVLPAEKDWVSNLIIAAITTHANTLLKFDSCEHCFHHISDNWVYPFGSFEINSLLESAYKCLYGGRLRITDSVTLQIIISEAARRFTHNPKSLQDRVRQVINNTYSVYNIQKLGLPDSILHNLEPRIYKGDSTPSSGTKIVRDNHYILARTLWEDDDSE